MNDNQWLKKESPLQGMNGMWGGVGSNLVSGGLTAWEKIKPDWFPMESDTPAPYAWYDMENRNGSTGISGQNPLDRSGNGRNMQDGVQITRTTCSGQALNGTHDCFTFNNGSSKIQLINGWPGVTQMSWIHLTSYLSDSGSDGRIWDCNDDGGTSAVNWFIGHHTGMTGICYYGNWLTQSDKAGNVFIVHYGSCTSSSIYTYYYKKKSGANNNFTQADGGNGDWPASDTGVCINNGPYGEQSDGKCIFFGTWDEVLTISERDAVVDAAIANYLTD